jgi:hypothetical protein
VTEKSKQKERFLPTVEMTNVLFGQPQNYFSIYAVTLSSYKFKQIRSIVKVSVFVVQ